MLHINKNSFFKPSGQKLLCFAKQPKLYNWNFRSDNLYSLFFKANILTSEKLSNLQIKRFAQGFANTYEKKINKNGRTKFSRKAETLSGEIFKESFIDILHTNFEQVAFSPPLGGYFFGEKPLEFTKTIERKGNVDFSTKKIWRTESKITREHTNRRLSKVLCPSLRAVLQRGKDGQRGGKIAFYKASLCTCKGVAPTSPDRAVPCPFANRRFAKGHGTARHLQSGALYVAFFGKKASDSFFFPKGIDDTLMARANLQFARKPLVHSGSFFLKKSFGKKVRSFAFSTPFEGHFFYEKAKLEALLLQKEKKPRKSTEHRFINKRYVSRISFEKQILLKKEEAEQKLFKYFVAKPISTREHNFGFTFKKNFNLKYNSQSKRTPIILNKKIGDYLSSGDKIGSFLLNKDLTSFPFSKSENSGSFRNFLLFLRKSYVPCPYPLSGVRASRENQMAQHVHIYLQSVALYLHCKSKICTGTKKKHKLEASLFQKKQAFDKLNSLRITKSYRNKKTGDKAFYSPYTLLFYPSRSPLSCSPLSCYTEGLVERRSTKKHSLYQSKTRYSKANFFVEKRKETPLHIDDVHVLPQAFSTKRFAVPKRGQGGVEKDIRAPKGQKEDRKSVEKAKERAHPIILNCSGRILTISKTQLVLQKTQPVLFYNSANLHVKKGEWVKEGSPILTLTHQTLITGDIVQGIPRIEQLFEAFTSPPSAFKDRERSVTKFQNVHDTLHSRVRDIFRKHWFKSILPIAVRKSLEEIQYILVESIQKVYLSQGVLIADKHIEIIIRQIASKGQILDSGTTGLFLEEILPIRQIENANLVTPGKKCLYVPAVVGLTAAALSSDSFISAASFQETTRVLSRDAFVGKSDFLRGLKEKVVIGDLISAGTGLDIYFIYTTMMAR